MIALEARGVCKRLGSKAVLKDLDLSVRAGSVFGLLGRNGAGKTTLIRLLMGLIRADSGSARVLGVDLAREPRIRAEIGYVADGEIFPTWCKIYDVLELERSCRGVWQDSAIQQWLEAEKIGTRQRVRQLSKGQRKRLEIEVALASRPKLLLLDEPFANLDPVSKSEVLQAVLDRTVDSQASVLLSSHMLSDLERICDTIGVLSGGHIAAQVALDDLKEHGGIVTKSDHDGPARLPSGLGVLAEWKDADRRSWIVTGLDQQRRAALADEGFALRDASLDEVGTELLRNLNGVGETA